MRAEPMIVFLFLPGVVFLATALTRAIFGVANRLLTGSWEDGLFRLVAAHMISLAIVGVTSLAGTGASDFPNAGSVVLWSIAYFGPSQAFLFSIDLCVYIWRRRREKSPQISS